MNKTVALVTGSNRGIGKACVKEFAKAGANVIINYCHHEEEALELKKEIEEECNVEALVIKCDVSNEEEVENMVNTIVDHFGGIDILVNNTGKIHSIPFPIIKIKLCKLYHYFIPRFFDNTDKYQENTQKIFIENIVNYLLNNIIQKNLQTGEEYSQALSFEASDKKI